MESALPLPPSSSSATSAISSALLLQLDLASSQRPSAPRFAVRGMQACLSAATGAVAYTKDGGGGGSSV